MTTLAADHAGMDSLALPPLALSAEAIAQRRESLLRLSELAGRGSQQNLAALIAARRDRRLQSADIAGHTAAVTEMEKPDPLALDAHALLLQEAARRAGVPARTLPPEAAGTMRAPVAVLELDTASGLFRYARRHLIRVDAGGTNGALLNGDCVRDTDRKHRAKEILRAAGIPVPDGRLFKSEEIAAALSYAALQPGEVCVKPNLGANGRRVFPGLCTDEEILEACFAVAGQEDRFIVEESVPGEAWRFFFVQPRIVGLKVGRPASVVGDGRKSLAELIDEKNLARAARGDAAYTRPLQTGLKREQMLRRQGLTLDAIPEAGRRVFLSPCANGSQGGETIALPKPIHPDYLNWMLQAFAAFDGLKIAAADVMIQNPAVSDPGGFHVLEINAGPSLLAYHYPWEGPVQDVCGAIIALLQRTV